MSDSRTNSGRAGAGIASDPPDAGTERGTDTITSMHDIFSCWERRAILYYLHERADPAPLDRLAAHLVGWRRGERTPAAPEADAVQRTRRSLLHGHVRKMENFGVVSYDPREDAVRLVDGMTVAVDPPWEDRDGLDGTDA